jgi:hypothetical protein
MAEIMDLQGQFNAAILLWEAEDVLRWIHNQQGNSVDEQVNLDRMKLLGIVAHDLQRQIGAKLA